MTTLLTAFVADHSDYSADELRVMRQSPDMAIDVGDPPSVFGDSLSRITVGEPGADNPESARSAYEWWPLTLDGRRVGELRDDANGLTIYIGRTPRRRNHPNRNT